MSSATPTSGPPRPREVTVGGLLAVIGSTIVLALLVGTMGELNSVTTRDALQKLVDQAQADSLGLTLDTARTIMKYMIMVLAVLSVASLVLGIFVLRRDRHSRIALTVLGGLALLGSLAAVPVGWVLSGYIAVSLGLLWTKPARAWFADPAPPPSGLPGGTPSPPPGHYPLPPGGYAPPQPPPGWKPPPAGWRPPPPPKR